MRNPPATAPAPFSITLRRQRAWCLAPGFTLLLLGLCLLPRPQESPNLSHSFWMAAAVLGAWQLGLLIRATQQRRVLRLTFVPVTAHWVQTAVQLAIYVYWGMHWSEVPDHAVHIVAQVAFAYVFDMLLCWSRRDSWRLGFGPLPIILSTNLFLWFRDDWFAAQFVMISVGFLGKEFIGWTKDGRRAHIFNPSALPLCLTSVVLLATGGTDLTWGREIASTLLAPEHIYLEIFVVGLAVQYFFSVTLMTLASAVAIYLLHLGYFTATGVYYFGDSTIPIAIFLGFHLLVTDPSTSPRTDLGRILFGTLYGVTVFAAFGLLDLAGAPEFYDKLLPVPFLNLSIRALDRIAGRLTQPRAGVAHLRRSPPRHNLAHMAIWSALFFGLLVTDEVGSEHAGRDAAFWVQACAEDRRNACRSLLQLQTYECQQGLRAEACNDVGTLLSERDPVGAQNSFARACAFGSAQGCANLETFVRGRTQTAQARQRACDQGQAAGCAELSLMFQLGDGVAQDEARAQALRDQACRMGWLPACQAATEAP